MKFYDCATAPSPRRVRIFIAEKGLDIETVDVDLAGGEQFGEAFRAVNPDCVVPALELDDGQHLTEVVAICNYLDALEPEPPLFGETPYQRAQSLMWNVKIEQQGLLAAADAFRNAAKGLKDRALPGPDNYAQIPELAERGRERVRAFFRKLNRQLDGQKFIVGERFGIADISGLVLMDFAARLKIDAEDDATELRRWYEKVAARPSAAL